MPRGSVGDRVTENDRPTPIFDELLDEFLRDRPGGDGETMTGGLADVVDDDLP